MINQFVCKHNKKILRAYAALFIHESQKCFTKAEKYGFGLIYREENTSWSRKRFAPVTEQFTGWAKNRSLRLSPKPHNQCHALCFPQDSLNLAKALVSEMKWFMFLPPNKSLNGDVTALWGSTDFPRLWCQGENPVLDGAAESFRKAKVSYWKCEQIREWCRRR